LNPLSSYAHIFMQITTFEETGRYEPAPEGFKLLARNLGRKDEETGEICMVGENLVHVGGARVVGMYIVWVD
jgi:FMN phosphatase YigB (HAD superfamily)